MENTKLLAFGVVLISTLFVVSLFFPSESPTNQMGDMINYKANVCIYKNGNLLECNHNLLTTAGKNLIKDKLSSNATSVVDYIGLCNATLGCSGGSAGNTTLDSEYASAGLSRALGTYNSNADGNWSIAKTFIATSDNLQTNQTGLFNASSDGTLFAVNSFSMVTLQTNDQLLVNWTISVS